MKCGKRFTTSEKVERIDLYVIKKDKTREKFEISKLKEGIEKAFEKRPVPKNKIDEIINQTEEQLRKKGVKEIKSSLIGKMVMKKIKKIDNIAYIRFASVYLNFQDIKDFKEELKEL